SVGAVVAAGRARAGAVVRPVLVREEVASLAELRALRIQGPRGESVLGDVADVALERVEDGTFFRQDGEEGALVRVFRAPEANAVALARRVRERVAEISPRASSGLRLAVVADRSAEVMDALKELGIATLEGLLLGVAVLRFMLGRWRPTLAMALVIPASVLATFAGFYLWGVPLDVVSLAGLALAAGMLVDSAIVVLESIEVARARGERHPEVTGTLEIALPVVASFLTTAVVFLPLVYLKGLARAFFGTQAFAIVVTSAVALLFSLTVTPVLSRGRWGSGGSEGRSPGRGLYLRLLDATLAHPAGAMILGIATVAVSALALALLPRELVPDGATRDLVVRYRLAPDLTPEAARRLGGEVEARAKSVLGAHVPLLAVQLPEKETGPGDRDETGRLALRFETPEAAAKARATLTAALSRLPDVQVRVEPRTSAFVESIERAGSRLEVVASASSPERAQALAHRVEERLRETAGLTPEAAYRDHLRPALLLSWNVPRLTALGADRADLERQVRDGLGERTAGRAAIAGAEAEILVRNVEPGDPALLPVASGHEVVPLAALAGLSSGARPPALERQDGQPAVRLTFEGAGGLHRIDPETLLAGVARGGDEQVAPGGQALELRRAFSQLRLALVLSIVLVFLTVAALYESLRTPLVLMTTVPVALGGALGLLALCGQTLNVMSFLGLILLAGIVVNNAIVLVHRMEDHLREGVGMDEAIRKAAFERYRPILMTTLTTLAGMLPLALLGGEGVELRRALALAVIGGMTTSTFASLLVVPVLYRWSRRSRA
ncbi:MAG TPA: efflux RND transporter permease subunit, partial [Thermoanaerobaculia bacterium]|nr:efflux RND transporter permease subunit [Thermoanaerobaculia bacterium]